MILVNLSCKNNNEKSFSLTGKTNDLENGTKLYLRHNNKTIDSATITDNSFKFSTQLDTFPVNIALHDKVFKNYTSFWVVNQPMGFDASQLGFKNAVITGSEPERLNNIFKERVDGLKGKERDKAEMQFVKDYPNSIISVSILSVDSRTWGREETKTHFELMSKENKSSKFGKQIKKYLELNKQPEIGDRYVDFESKNINGKSQKLSELEGKTVLLEFWASWCGPCRKENPNLVKTYNEFKNKGFEIFAVSQDSDKNSWVKAIEQDGLPWMHVSDLKGDQNEASLIYGIYVIPDNFLISKDGIIIGRNLKGKELVKKLEEILN